MEEPRVLANLGRNAHFGEVSLLTEELRSASIIVTSPTAKCLRMRKSTFSEILSNVESASDEVKRKIGQKVVEKVSIFQTLTQSTRARICQVMVGVSFPSDSYICRQGTPGNTFYIITEGSCKVTLNNADHTEKEVAQLHIGDFFGK